MLLSQLKENHEVIRLKTSLCIMRKIFTEGISSAEDRAAAETYGHKLSIILGIVSSDDVYDIKKYRDHCTQLYVHLLTKLSLGKYKSYSAQASSPFC